jgi:hypothetical protein
MKARHCHGASALSEPICVSHPKNRNHIQGDAMKNNPTSRAMLPVLAASMLLAATQTSMAEPAQASAARIAAATR